MSMLSLKQLVFHLPLVGRRLADRAELYRAFGPYRPGHYHSPIPSLDEVHKDGDRLWRVPRTLPGIELREEAQLALLDQFADYYKDLPFPEQPLPERRYHLDNAVFAYADGITLYCMLRHVRPQQIIEVGSGYTSAAMLDTNELCLGNSVRFTFIEPYPERLYSLLRPEDRERTTVIEKRAQDVPVETFCSLRSGDILFIDSTHVAKIGSDVNYLIGEVLPLLDVGVYIHFHDVPYPFEYFREWIDKGIAWNEAYMVRAFLLFNRTYEIEFFNTYLEHFHVDWFKKNMPLCLRNTGGSLWLRKVAV
jgi:hypothetical protein